MSSPNPAVLINGSPAPQDVTASSTVTLTLVNPTGVSSWTPAVVSTDETNTVAAIAATLSVNPSTKTATFTAPALGSAVRFSSTVRDQNGNAFSTTFVVNVKSTAGTRVLALDESFEQDPVNGWLPKLNPILRTGGGGSGGSGGQTNLTLANGLNSNVNTTGLLVARIGGPTAAFSIDGILSPSAGGGAEVILWNTTSQQMTIVDASSSVSSAANRISTIRGTPVNPVVRGGSVARLTYDATLGHWVLTASGYLEENRYNARDFGADEGNQPAANDTAFAAWIAAQAADNFRRPLFLPRVTGNTGAHYEISKPIEITHGGAIIECENNNSPIRCDGFIGPLIIVRPPFTAPTPVQDGTTGYWGVPFTGSVGSWLMLSAAHHGLNLNQAQLTVELEFNATDATIGSLFISAGRRGIGEPITTALRILFTGGKIRVDFTTAGSGFQSFTSTASPSTGTRHSIAVSYDGTKMRLYIDGNYDSGQAATGNMVQGYEVVAIGGETGDWPYGSLGSGPIKGSVYCYRIFNTAKYTSQTNPVYTPPASEPTTTNYDGHGDNCLLLLNFDPNYLGTSATGPSGMIKGLCQRSTVGAPANTPVYIPWSTGGSNQITGPILRRIYLQSVMGGPALWLEQTPNSLLEDCRFIGRVSWVNNCYESKVRRTIIGPDSFVGSVSGWPSTPSWGLMISNACTVCDIADLQVSGATGYAIIGVNGGGVIRSAYIIAGGAGGFFFKSVGEQDGWYLDSIAVGDEAGLITDHVIYVSGAVTIAEQGGGINWLQTDGPALIDIDNSYGSVILDGGFWGFTGTPHKRCIRFLNQPLRPVIVDCGQQTVGTSSGVAIPWMPETSEVGVLSGTATFTTGSYTVTFTSAQTLTAGSLITSSNQAGITYRIAANTSASTTAQLTQPFTGNTASGLTATIVGQGPVLLTEQEGFGTNVINYASDADKTLLVNDFLYGRIKLTSTGSLTATRKAIAPMIAGYTRKVWNATTGGQAITWIGPTGTGINIPNSTSPFFTEVYCDGTNWGAG